VTSCGFSESKSDVRHSRKPKIWLLVARVVIITVLATLLSFAIALFFAVTGIMLVAMIRGGGVNLTAAYRHIALPIALVTLVIAFVVNLVIEIRYYRRARMNAPTDLSRVA